MAGKKDTAVIAVLSGLSINQASQISRDIMRSKEKYAPLGRGTIASCPVSNVGALLQRGHKMIGGK